MIVSEKTLNGILDQLDTDSAYHETLSDQFHKVFEDYFIYLEQEIFSILKAPEADLLLFIHYVVTEAYRKSDLSISAFELHSFFDMEEDMWAQYEEESKKGFRDRISPTFTKLDEEELLAFVEDLLLESSEEEEIQVSATGRDVIWNVSSAFIGIMKKRDD